LQAVIDRIPFATASMSYPSRFIVANTLSELVLKKQTTSVLVKDSGGVRQNSIQHPRLQPSIRDLGPGMRAHQARPVIRHQ